MIAEAAYGAVVEYKDLVRAADGVQTLRNENSRAPAAPFAQRAAQRGFLNATDLADYLTKKGLPFRAAYKIAGQLVAYCIEHTTVLEELPLTLLRQYSERFGEDVYAAIALTNCVTGRTSLGGTCVASVEAQIASVRDFLAGQTETAKQAKNG